MSYAVIDGCPAPAKLEPLLAAVKADTGCTYQSIYRGADAERLLRENGKHSQAALYDGFRRGLPGFNPANPPGRSTHELRSDGAAYAGPVGRRLSWWQCGIDVDDAHVKAFIAACAKHGWSAHITYPTSRLEYHHVNLTKAPRYGLAVWWRIRPVKERMTARTGRARWVVKTLRYLESPRDHKRYLSPHGKPPQRISREVVHAIERFQADHKQHPDGIVGVQTFRQLRAAKRSQTRKRKTKAKAKASGKAKPHPVTGIDQAGITFIRAREGCVLHPYNDSRGFATIGVGHLIAQRPVNDQDRQRYANFTQADADRLLAADLERYVTTVMRVFDGAKLPATQNRVNACCSLAFNIGETGFTGSTVAKRIRAGDEQGAADAFLMWNRPPELTARRRLERALFLRNPRPEGSS